MARRILTAADIEGLPRGGEVTLPRDSIITDRARELAGERGVRIRTEEPITTPHQEAQGTALQTRHGAAPGGTGHHIGNGPVALGSDHAGYELKQLLKDFLLQSGYEVRDLGTDSSTLVDYPDFAYAVAQAVATGAAWRGIVVDATGIGSAMTANKVAGARAAVCYDKATAQSSREHNDANVLTLGARLLRSEQALTIAAVWLETEFAGGRHQRRLDKITAIERGDLSSNTSMPSQQREQLIEAITREIFSYLGDRFARPGTPWGVADGTSGAPTELRGLEIDEVVCPGCDGRCVETCHGKAHKVITAGAARLTAGLGVSRIPADIAALIDHTLLRAEASRADILKLCDEAKQFGFATAVVNPSWVALAAAALRGTPVKVCSVAGFPLGATLPRVKIVEAEEVVKLGAQEVDMVINLGALKSGQHELVQQEIRGVVEATHRAGALCKVILECVLLTDQEKVLACRLAQAAGADFVKTSTGFGPGGATAHDVELMRLVVGPQMGVKAAGSIRSYDDLQKMLSAGATRIGASASVKILQEAAGVTAPTDAPASTRY